jgi:xylulokinase
LTILDFLLQNTYRSALNHRSQIANKNMLTLGIDSGTQSTKTIVLDFLTGKIIASAQQAYGMVPGLAPGHLEQEPKDWIAAVDATVRECLQTIGKRKDEVVAIGVSGQQHGMVALDSKYQPVRPAKLWCDTSTTEQCREFAEEFGGAKGLIELAGNPILPGYTASKILWMKENEPKNFKATQCFLLPHDYINLWLTGERRMEFGDASSTGLLDIRTREWCKPLCDFIDKSLVERLPKPETSRKPVGLLRENLRKLWGLEKSPVISAGGGDNMMGAIGTGNIGPGILTASLGTSGTLYSCSDEPVVDPNGEVAAFCDSNDKWLPLVCTMNVTVVTEQVRSLFGWEVAEFDAAVASVHPGADGLLFLPYLNGERTPNLPHGSGVLHGMNTQNTTPPHLARAAMEGATLGLAYGLHRLRELGIAPTEIRLTGGGSNSAIWRQIAADVFGVPTVCLTSPEGAALGAAIQSAWIFSSVTGHAIRLRDATDRIVELDAPTRCEPNTEATALYAELLHKQSDLTRKLRTAAYL